MPPFDAKMGLEMSWLPISRELKKINLLLIILMNIFFVIKETSNIWCSNSNIYNNRVKRLANFGVWLSIFTFRK